MKDLKTTEELIQHMEDKGITFNYVSKDEAADFLKRNNYYLKLAAYRFNFPKHLNGNLKGRYINLDFGHLKELSTLDRHLRYLILEMCMDIEHYMKVRLLDDAASNPEEDGYRIVQQYLKSNNRLERSLRKIRSHKSSPYCKDLIEKYYPNFPLWVFVEVISFGELTSLCEFYNETYHKNIFGDVKNKFINNVRDVRNACAHSNCLMNNLFDLYTGHHQPDIAIRDFYKQAARGFDSSTLSKTSFSKYSKTEFSYTMLVLLYVYYCLVPNKARNKAFLALKELVSVRMKKNASYFKNHIQFLKLWAFWDKVVDSLASLSI